MIIAHTARSIIYFEIIAFAEVTLGNMRLGLLEVKFMNFLPGKAQNMFSV